jgi:ribosomal protein L37E
LDCGIDPGPAPKIAHPDGTQGLMERYGLDPTDRDDYLRLAFGGNPPQEPLDGEIEAELPLELQIADIDNAPSAGDCGEPSRTTLQGFPLCARCGRSTRNMNALVCAPCRKGTRLLLTVADRRWLKGIGISR